MRYLAAAIAPTKVLKIPTAANVFQSCGTAHILRSVSGRETRNSG